MNKNSRISIKTPSKFGTDSQITTNYAHSILSAQQLECSIHEELESQIVFSSYVPLTKHLGIRSQKIEKLVRQNQIRRGLNKISIVKYRRLKQCFQQFKNPKSGKHKNKNTGQQTEDWFIGCLVRKTRITGQTAFLRTILNHRKVQEQKKMHQIKSKSAQQQKLNKVQNNKHKICNIFNNNITIHPDEHGPSIQKLKYAIMFLEQRSKNKIKNRFKLVFRKFHDVAWRCQVIDRYYLRVYRRMIENKRVFIQKVKLMAKIKHEQILQTKRKLMRNFLDKALERRQKMIFKSLRSDQEQLQKNKIQIKTNSTQKKNSSARLLMKTLENKIIINYKFWISQIKQLKKNSRHHYPAVFEVSIIPEPLQEEEPEPSEEPIEQSQKKIITLQKFVRVCERYGTSYGFWKIYRKYRFMKALEKCAIKLACAPKICIQRSLWRLNINAFAAN